MTPQRAIANGLALGVALLLLLILFGAFGCAPQQVEGYTPFVPKSEMKDPGAFKDDLALCRSDALEYLGSQSSLDPVSVASAGVQGALDNLASAAISPLATGLSGVGNASGEATNELGLGGVAAKRVVAWCMFQKGLRSGSYTVMTPEL